MLTCFTSTNVQILTPEELKTPRALCARVLSRPSRRASRCCSTLLHALPHATSYAPHALPHIYTAYASSRGAAPRYCMRYRMLPDTHLMRYRIYISHTLQVEVLLHAPSYATLYATACYLTRTSGAARYTAYAPSFATSNAPHTLSHVSHTVC